MALKPIDSPTKSTDSASESLDSVMESTGKERESFDFALESTGKEVFQTGNGRESKGKKRESSDLAACADGITIDGLLSLLPLLVKRAEDRCDEPLF